ncbi:MAG: hypothetical protein A2X82_15850 [Geobacteraceae bacterium GWC2_55_20]|nr:MAG: hypothetical protein A2X82_15850 [Geobacteraceae bacterium GWC2_55_20]OGU23585.1 MAG: hypothetical protein A2X85_01835 [Geobacteraceae bacterium GWF2_54_21]
MNTGANYPIERLQKGMGAFSGPAQNTQFNQIVELIKVAMPLFAASAQQENINNENGLNRRLARFITNIADNHDLPYFAQTESMEDETRGDSPATDFGIHLKIDDISVDPPKIALFEGKRLSGHTGSSRRREYVIGHEKNGRHVPCGGIERFKCSLHGRDFRYAGIIGYIQEETPDYWYQQLNSWISELTSQEEAPRWSHEEQLSPICTSELLSESASIVIRKADKLHLTHLWINLVS